MDSGSVVLETLTEQECLRLLLTVPLGRIVFTDRALPAILPAYFVINGRSLVVRTSLNSRLAAAHGTVVAFEADQCDPLNRTGWYVTVTGHAHVVDDSAEIKELSSNGLPAWIPVSSDCFVRIYGELITGRRVRRTRPGPEGRSGAREPSGGEEQAGGEDQSGAAHDSADSTPRAVGSTS
jgi:uncharacterized protein